MQPYLTWHSRRISLLYCSLTGTASSWYDRLPQNQENDWSSFLQLFGKKFSKSLYMFNENVRHYALGDETLVNQGWYNEYPPTINLNCNEVFTRGLQKKFKDFANKRQVKNISSSLEPSILFISLVNMVD